MMTVVISIIIIAASTATISNITIVCGATTTMITWTKACCYPMWFMEGVPYFYYWMVLTLAAYHNRDKTYLDYNACKLHTFYNISYLQSNCFYQTIFSLSISFRICFCKPIRELVVCDKMMSLKAMNLQKERECNSYNGHGWFD